MSIFLKYIGALLIVLSLIVSAWYVLHGSIVFHTDIARDFLLIEDIVKNKPITLIGPRSGGIPGVFHGPLWLYMNVPAFLVGGGNPVVVGWFWILLSLINLFVTYYISWKLFKNKIIALLSVVLVAAATLLDVRALYNPWGALMLAPVFFYFFWNFTKKNEFKYLALSLFVLGLIVQFQMAFGVPLTILSAIFVLRIIIKTKKIKLFFAFLILLIPLSTFILFDLKHQFLQSKAVVNFISGKENFGKIEASFVDLVDDRVRRLFTDVPHFITDGRWILIVPFMFLIAIATHKLIKLKDKGEREVYVLFLYFYLGYWFLTLFFSGQIWGYYYWPFLPLVAILFSSLYRYVDKKLFCFVFIGALVTNFMYSAGQNIRSDEFLKEDGGSWKFYERVADDVFSSAGEDFGYYIFSPDQFGYSTRYALHYKQQDYSNVKAHSFAKKRFTYLIITPSDNPFLSIEGWKAGQVKLTKKPVNVKKYRDGVTVEKYELTPEEIAIPSDPNIIGATLLFR